MIERLKWFWIKIFGKKVISIKGNIIVGVYEFRKKLWMWNKKPNTALQQSDITK